MTDPHMSQPAAAHGHSDRFESLSMSHQQAFKIPISGISGSQDAFLTVTGTVETARKFHPAAQSLIPQANEPAEMMTAFQTSLKILQLQGVFPTNEQIETSERQGGAFCDVENPVSDANQPSIAGRGSPPIKNVFFIDGVLAFLRHGAAYHGHQSCFELGLLTHDLDHNTHRIDIFPSEIGKPGTTHTLWMLRKVQATRGFFRVDHEESFLGFTYRSDHPLTKPKPKPSISPAHFRSDKDLITERYTVEGILSGKAGLTPDHFFGEVLLYVAMGIKNTNLLTEKINNLRQSPSSPKLTNNNLTKRITAALKAKAWLEDRSEDEVMDEYDIIVRGKVNTRRKQIRDGTSRRSKKRKDVVRTIVDNDDEEELMAEISEDEEEEGMMFDEEETADRSSPSGPHARRGRSSRRQAVSYAEPGFESSGDEEDEEDEEGSEQARKRVKLRRSIVESDDSDVYED
ncbi:uncharacterized protein MYCFIDRAFT_194451 [Pseudocercospora fijiensis CIRAD86]|uniref:Uncharacterized protein n=1 Tax=Pseudocercospora fijiensis (strain CIRAD86) TaxID=383855 RepID=M2Z996_PSEFD|nr:uncharacterized protein MYCFIDRAFT_194451 [Pseudocercospora fijiensis CIRAD86]EME86375.1 hypothetical protein MYCFIDRAFT_194451 [Pseudocercospora fijiensis CIRAD86]